MGPADVAVGGGGSTLSFVHTTVGTFAYNLTVINKSSLRTGISSIMGKPVKDGSTLRKFVPVGATPVPVGLLSGVYTVSTSDVCTPTIVTSPTSFAIVPHAI